MRNKKTAVHKETLKNNSSLPLVERGRFFNTLVDSPLMMGQERDAADEKVEDDKEENQDEEMLNLNQSELLEEKEHEHYYPHCILPEHFFSRTQFIKARNLATNHYLDRRVLFSVQTWDGREVVSVEKN